MPARAERGKDSEQKSGNARTDDRRKTAAAGMTAQENRSEPRKPGQQKAEGQRQTASDERKAQGHEQITGTGAASNETPPSRHKGKEAA
jgi:hypothetical protein